MFCLGIWNEDIYIYWHSCIIDAIRNLSLLQSNTFLRWWDMVITSHYFTSWTGYLTWQLFLMMGHHFSRSGWNCWTWSLSLKPHQQASLTLQRAALSCSYVSGSGESVGLACGDKAKPDKGGGPRYADLGLSVIWSAMIRYRSREI